AAGAAPTGAGAGGPAGRARSAKSPARPSSEPGRPVTRAASSASATPRASPASSSAQPGSAMFFLPPLRDGRRRAPVWRRAPTSHALRRRDAEQPEPVGEHLARGRDQAQARVAQIRLLDQEGVSVVI